MKKEEKNKINSPFSYMLDYLAEFRIKYPRIVSKKNINSFLFKELTDAKFASDYRKYNNYMAAIVHPKEVILIAESLGYSTETFPINFLNETDWRILKQLLEANYYYDKKYKINNLNNDDDDKLNKIKVKRR